MSENQLTESKPQDIINPEEQIQRMMAESQLIDMAMKKLMKKDQHFGVIPGTRSPTLLKAGGEVLCRTFGFSPETEVERHVLQNGHVEYVAYVKLMRGESFVGSGVGSASTLESKYRYRSEFVSNDLPKEYWETRDPEIIGGPNHHVKKKDGKWCIYKRIEHDNPADYYNTVLKMAKKRAFIDAVLTRTAASNVFTQDLEDLVDNGVIKTDGNGETDRKKKDQKAEHQGPPPEGSPADVRQKRANLEQDLKNAVHASNMNTLRAIHYYWTNHHGQLAPDDAVKVMDMIQTAITECEANAA